MQTSDEKYTLIETINPEPNPNEKCNRRIFPVLNLKMDPPAAIVEDGRVLEFSDEESIKHAQNLFNKEWQSYATSNPSVLVV